ncbi:MAG: hypothetical protein K5663_06845 [Clostridiales bacterium]|nr:hypothetical protein [Clostridiales bacterium]
MKDNSGIFVSASRLAEHKAVLTQQNYALQRLREALGALGSAHSLAADPRYKEALSVCSRLTELHQRKTQALDRLEDETWEAISEVRKILEKAEQDAEDSMRTNFDL